MSDVYYPNEIKDQALGDVSETTGSNSGANLNTQTYTPVTAVDKNYPPKFIARETISQTLNTKEKKIKGAYTFSKQGSIVVGGYVNGVSGEISISPDGIVAKNVNGDTTVAIDGTTGDSTFKGTVSAGSVIAGATEVGDGSIVIDGANNRITVDDGSDIRIVIGNI
jgi:hypothetical protein